MEGIALIIWMLLTVAIPIILIVISIINYKRQAEITLLVFAFLSAVMIYIFAAFCSLMALVVLMNAIEPSLSKPPGLLQKLLYFVVILIYGLLGCFLCFFVQSTPVKTRITYNESQSIFDNSGK